MAQSTEAFLSGVIIGLCVASSVAGLVLFRIRDWCDEQVKQARGERDYFAGLVAQYEAVDDDQPELATSVTIQ